MMMMMVMMMMMMMMMMMIAVISTAPYLTDKGGHTALYQINYNVGLCTLIG